MLTDEDVKKEYSENFVHSKNAFGLDEAFIAGANFVKDHYEKELAEKTQENLKLIEDNANRSEEKHYLIQSYEKQNEELKAQIEKMKCCENCKHWGYASKRTCVSCSLDSSDKWELKV